MPYWGVTYMCVCVCAREALEGPSPLPTFAPDWPHPHAESKRLAGRGGQERKGWEQAFQTLAHVLSGCFQ